MANTIRIGLEEIRKHVGHEIVVDSGVSGYNKYLYGIFCRTCDKEVGTCIEIDRNRMIDGM